MTKGRTWFTYVEACRECMRHGEYHNMAATSWIPGRPETVRHRCMHCRARDAIKDGSVQLAELNRIKKMARQIEKNTRKIAHLLTPRQKQWIADDCDQILQVLGAALGLLNKRAKDLSDE